MGAPERIHCNWNAADAADAFRDAGVGLDGFFQNNVHSEQLIEVLAKKTGDISHDWSCCDHK